MATWALLCQAMIDRAVGSRDPEVAGGMLDVVAKVSLVSEPEVDVTGADGRGTGTCGRRSGAGVPGIVCVPRCARGWWCRGRLKAACRDWR